MGQRARSAPSSTSSPMAEATVLEAVQCRFDSGDVDRSRMTCEHRRAAALHG